MDDDQQFVTESSLESVKQEIEELKVKILPEIAKRIDDAKQQGDLSENAEYHQAREDMSWAQGRLQTLEQIVNNAAVIKKTGNRSVGIGNTVTVKVNGAARQYTIVGAHEANPGAGLISNESPLGQAFIGRGLNESVEISVPSGRQVYQIIGIS